MIEPTGERVLPDQQRVELVYAEHVSRYALAMQLAPGRALLDAACGEGYGTAMLAGAGATRVVGVDIDSETTAHASERYGLEFLCADVLELPFEAATFDVVVSFETIEHVADGERAVAEFKRVLRPGGLLIASTPNKQKSLIENEFHVREYTHDEFVDLLHKHFGALKLLYQDNWLASAILDEQVLAARDGIALLDIDFYKTGALGVGQELYTIAVCGDAALPSLRHTAVASGIYEAHELARQVRDWNERSAEAERLVGEWNARATEAERQVEETRATLARLEASLSWRITAPLRSVKSRVRGRRDA